MRTHSVKLGREVVDSLISSARVQQRDLEQYRGSAHMDQILSALFCMKVVTFEEYPQLREILLAIPEERREQYFVWRWHTHRLCDQSTQERVMAAILSMSRLEVALPNELLDRVLILATSKNYFEE